MTRILYTKPSITDLEMEYVRDAVSNGWGEKCYDYISRFENAFRDHLDVSFAIATSSCTGALQLGLAAMGIGRGDEVILSDTNWIATVAPIVHLGATPVFVDIDPVNWCIDPKLAERAITSRTRAIVATHLYGNLCNMDALLDLGRSYDIPIIEDAAEAIGSVWRGRRAGSIGKFGTFSFHGSKTISTGEGGMFVTSDPELFETVLTLSNHGRDRSEKRQFWANLVGYKFKLSNVQAAIGCGQLERIDELVARKREILSNYRSQLCISDDFQINPEPPGTVNGSWMPTIVFESKSGVTRSELLRAFTAANIDARVFFHPLSSQPMFDDRRINVHAWSIPTRAINLPSYHDMTDYDIDRVCTTFQVAFEQELK